MSNSQAAVGSTTANSTEMVTTIKVMAYNIHHANPPSKPGFIDLDAIAEVIRAQNPDLVALQEVDVNTERSGAFNQAEELAKRLGMHYFFGKAIDYTGGEYGVAILSKYPLSETQVNRLPTQEGTRGEPRILATAKVRLPNGADIRFGSTHLDAQREPINRRLQINKIAEIAASEKLPFIIAGDFNATPDSEVIQVLDKHFTRTCMSCDPTIPVINPNRTIDYIAFSHPADKFKVASQMVINESYASDHLPIVAEINIEQ
ncbi:endonuclease/exonuclease/phosphatase [Flammeovirgaceae bacterium 311]|nr:endonuclease/exonuclease/phosphatase [Flammeovirgaceae bacterium 311]